MNKNFYLLAVLACAISAIYLTCVGNYKYTAALVVLSCALSAAAAESSFKDEAWKEYGLVEETALIIWDKEDLSYKYATEAVDWLHDQSYKRVIRFVDKFTNHNYSIFHGKEQETFEWVLIRFYPYDWCGISILIYLRSDMSYIITVEDNEKHMSSIIKQLIAPVVEDGKPYVLEIDNIKPYALKWEFYDS